MLSSKKKGFFFETSEFSFCGATATAFEPPLTVQEFFRFSSSEEAKLKEHLGAGNSGRGGRKLVHSKCSVYPNSRFVCRSSIDLKKLKEPDYLADLLTTEFQINPDHNEVRVLDPESGAEVDLGNALTKNILFCGAKTEDFVELQNQLIDFGLYPKSIELGTLNSIAGMIDYLSWKGQTSPVLCVEIQSDSSNVFIIRNTGLQLAKRIEHGIDSMVPRLQSELALTDEASARTLLFSQTLDFEDIGSRLLRKLLHELQASTGFFEVQTGISVGSCFVPVIPKGFSWINGAINDSLGLKTLDIDLVGWLKSRNIQLADSVLSSVEPERDFGFFSTIGNFSTERIGNEVTTEEK